MNSQKQTVGWILFLLLLVLLFTGPIWGPWVDRADAASPNVTVESMPAVTIGVLPLGQTCQSDSFKNITAADNNAVKSSAGTLTRITVNSVTTSGTITVYDNTVCAGAKIATITAPYVGMPMPGGLAFSTGLCVNTGGSTNMDLTVTYR